MNSVQEKETEEILAIDFGTVNTYVSKCSAINCLPKGIDFNVNKTGIATTILERKGRSPIIGDIGIEEFCEATIKERQNYKLFTQFKPDIYQSNIAKQLSIEYLKTLLIDAQKQNIDIEPLTRKVIFGIPSANSQKESLQYSECLKEIAQQAGYGNIKVIDESLGALLFHISMGNLSALDAQKGVLVIDFGGGTCDFSVIKNGKTYKSWGEKRLGGRLFDDLFFQWFLDENPRMLKALKKENRENYTLLIDAKNIKESFSELIARDKNTIIHRSIGNYGHIEKLCLEGFNKRAHSYQMSEVFKLYLNNIGAELDENADKKVDLLSWFEKILLSGFETDKIFSMLDIEYVILAGGSSLWYFVSDIVKKHFPNARIIRSDRPYATVSEGLAILPALKKKNMKVRELLLEDLPQFCSSSMKKSLEQNINKQFEILIDELTVNVLEKRIIPVIRDFKKTGGTLDKLNSEIQSLPGINDEIQNIVDLSINRIKENLEIVLKNKISEWFKSYNVCVSDDAILKNNINYPIDVSSISQVDGIYNLVNNLLGGIAGILVATICANPVSMVLGFIGAFFVVFFGAEAVNKIISKKINVAPEMANLIFNEKKIQQIKKNFKKNLINELKKENSKFIKQSMLEIKKFIQVEIDALNEIQTI